MDGLHHQLGGQPPESSALATMAVSFSVTFLMLDRDPDDA